MCAFRNSKNMRNSMNLKGSATKPVAILSGEASDSNPNSNQELFSKRRQTQPVFSSSSTNITDVDEYSDPSDIESDSECDEEDDVNDLWAQVDVKNSDQLLQVTSLASIIQRKALEEDKEISINKEAILSTQNEMTTKHREIVVRWLIQLNYHFKLTSDTLYNAVTFFDIFISKVPVKLTEVQLYAAVCYWMSAKVDTRCQPTVEDFNEISNETFTVQQFSRVELQILKALNFKLSFPTSKLFMRRLLLLTTNDQYEIEMANFFTEIALQKWDFVGISQYLISIAAVFSSCASLGKEDDAFMITRTCPPSDIDRLVEIIKLMIQHGIVLSQKHKDIKKCAELFSQLNFNIDLQHYFGDSA